MSIPDDMKTLMTKKDEIEKEIKELTDVLDSQKGVGMKGQIIDGEGYPRADIDVYTVRHARNRIICLQNDHKDIMKSIEQNLHAIHAKARSERQTEERMETDDAAGSVQALRKPFAKVDRVDAGSPAATAGLLVGDNLVQFGSISTDNFQTLKGIGELVKHSKGRTLSVVVIRDNKEIRLELIPQTWGGRGLLGCNIVPIK